MEMQQLFAVSVLIFSNNILSEPGADITLNLNINTNTDKGKSEEESVLLVRDNENRRALGRSLRHKINIYRDKMAFYYKNIYLYTYIYIYHKSVKLFQLAPVETHVTFVLAYLTALSLQVQRCYVLPFTSQVQS